MLKGLFPVVSHDDVVFPDDFFDNFFNDFASPVKGSYRVPRVDIEDTDKAYILTADLPGMKKEDISVTYDNDVLTLLAKHETKTEDSSQPQDSKAAGAADAKDSKDAKAAEAKPQKKYIRQERTNTAFCRQFTVRNIQKDGIEASYKDGVLTVTMPKVDPQKEIEAHRIEIK